MANRKKKSFTIVEIAAITSMVTLTGFLGFTYVNKQQKLASSNNTPSGTINRGTESNFVTESDIKPINSSDDLALAHAQLDSMASELDNAKNSITLTQDLSSITN